MTGSAVALFCVMCALHAAGLMRYEIWSQIEYINNAELGSNLAGMLVHLPRYLVVVPAYLAAAASHTEPNTVYGYYVLGTLLVTSARWAAVRQLVGGDDAVGHLHLLPLFLAPLINGRFAFGLCGLSLLLELCVRNAYFGVTVGRLLLLLPVALLTSVSSGIFSVGLLFFILTFRRQVSGAGQGRRQLGLAQRATLLALSLPSAFFFLLFLNKNLDFYGGGLSGLMNMLSHGLGLLVNPAPLLQHCRTEGEGRICSFVLVLVDQPTIWIALIESLILFAVLVIVMLRQSKANAFARIGIAVGAMGGVFGFTTLLASIFVLPLIGLRNPSNTRTTVETGKWHG